MEFAATVMLQHCASQMSCYGSTANGAVLPRNSKSGRGLVKFCRQEVMQSRLQRRSRGCSTCTEIRIS
jgi:hypothetical protein